MSRRTRELPRRSVHVVPGSSDRFLRKAVDLRPDAFVFDLEDSVVPAEKANARDAVVSALTQAQWPQASLAVRVNDWSSSWTVDDVTAVVGGARDLIDTIVLPKVSRASEVAALDRLLSALEPEFEHALGNIGIEVLIESALGLVHVDEIASASRRVESVIFGPLDFAASLGMSDTDLIEDPANDAIHVLTTVRTRALVAARAAGVAAIDGPYVEIGHDEGLGVSARRAAMMGFDGKWSGHPDQIAPINKAFTPTQASFDRARALLESYEAAVNGKGQGALRFGGSMIDEATRKLALGVVRRGELGGLSDEASVLGPLTQPESLR
jgi:citrate lyase subunit beta / citryl-CoA lyase